MTTFTTSAAATLRPAGVPSLVVPTSAAAFWQLGNAPSVLGGHDVVGYSRDAGRMIADPAPHKSRRDLVAAAKQARSRRVHR